MLILERDIENFISGFFLTVFFSLMIYNLFISSFERIFRKLFTKEIRYSLFDLCKSKNMFCQLLVITFDSNQY